MDHEGLTRGSGEKRCDSPSRPRLADELRCAELRLLGKRCRRNENVPQQMLVGAVVLALGIVMTLGVAFSESGGTRPRQRSAW